MEEMLQEERPTVWAKLKSKIIGDEPLEDEGMELADASQPKLRIRAQYAYQVTVRRQVLSFQDAVAAAEGLKKGEQQVMNLSGAEPAIREKIKDFMSGVNFAEEGTWEELGENIFMIAPKTATVEVAPASPRMTAQRN
jgi:cell division inhibitor SepF